MDKFFKISRCRGSSLFIIVKGEFVPAHDHYMDYVRGVRWIKTTQKWSSNRYCFGGDIHEITEAEVGA